jgi:eukaryotic-like serine/threonine-protein kinase
MRAPANWERVRALFHSALDCPRQERGTFITEQSDGDEALRHEVESLLAAHDAAEGFLDEPAPGPTSDNDALEAAPRLAMGSRLGAFELLDLLGVGGMGEVYRARDTRLDRFVALKVISSELAIDARGRDRFEREARTISKLTHPHICTVYDVGTAHLDGNEVQFLVMELLQGESLADRLKRQGMSIEQALQHAIEIADALAAAHDQGIVHRDLKPANVMLTRSGVKLLDFGLAQLRASEVTGASSTESSHAPLTSAGMILGTLPYMSPEQLRGEEADSRADLFAFGGVLHEMLTGHRAFAAESPAALIAAILEREPPSASELQPAVPAALDRVVRRCLAKDREERWQTARDLRSELQWVRDGRGSLSLPSSVVASRRREWRRPIALGASIIAACLVAALVWLLWPAPVPPRLVTRLSLNFPPGVTLDIPIASAISFAVAPDGRRVAYVGTRNGSSKSLFIYALDTARTIEIAGTKDANHPAFSPDGEWLAFAQGQKISKVAATGGPMMTLCEKCPAVILTWLRDNRLLAAGLGNPIREALAPGKEPSEAGQITRPLTKWLDGDEGHHRPALLPDGSVLFTRLRSGWHSALNSIAVSNPSSGPEAGASHDVALNATSAQLVGRDALVFARGHSFLAARFDADRAQLVGEPLPLDLRVQPAAYSAAPMYALSNNGTLVYAQASGDRRLVWVDRRGREELVDTGERFYTHLRLSPDRDGSRVAVYEADADRDLWLFDLNRPTPTKLTFGPGRDAMPVFSPDGQRIYFTTEENKVSWIAADRSGTAVTLFAGPQEYRIHPLSITPDGRTLIVSHQKKPNGQTDLATLTVGPNPRLTLVLSEPYPERDGRLSPDGKWLAYQSEESGLEEVLVRPFPAVTTRRWVISVGRAQQPIWSRDGKEIFYRTEDGTIMSVAVKTTPTFEPASPVPVVSAPQTLRNWSMGPTYDVSPDGRRFLMIKAPELDIRSLSVVQNWDVEVKATIAKASRK